MIGVYQIFIEDYCYWGSSKDCEKRCADHLKDLERGKHCNNKMQAVFNKYKTFDFQIIVACDDRDVAYLYEQDYIDAHFGLDKCMNLNPIATKPPSNKGKKASAKTRAKMSSSLIGNTRSVGRKLTDETKAKLSAAATGKTHTDEAKAKMSAATTGKTHTDEHKAKIGAASKSRKHTDEAKAKISEAVKNAPKFHCLHCGRSFRDCNFKHHHGDNCKLKQEVESAMAASTTSPVSH